MDRAFVGPLDVASALAAGEFLLDAPTAKRFQKVLRLQAGDRVEVFGDGQRLEGALALDGPARLVELTELPPVADIAPVVLVQAMTKTSKLEEVVRRAGELGAAEVALFVADRTQGRLKDDKQAQALRERLERIAVDASRQCGRSTVCKVSGPLSFREIVARFGDASSVVVFGALDATQSLSGVLAAHQSTLVHDGVVAFIGPEGGLTTEECAALDAAGAKRVRLAAHTLRTETAGLAVLAAVQVSQGSL